MTQCMGALETFDWNTAANGVSALGVDGEEDYDEDVEPVHTEEGFSALQRCLDTGLAACALADVVSLDKMF